jgi:glycosyltransferase involved in cell wall biosynthesis
MELLKGGSTLLDALPLAAERLDKPIRLVFAGDGPKRKAWERQASRIQSRRPSLEFDFRGWVDKRQLELHYAESDLLVVPSLWPEPFGRIGPEAGLRGVPVAAFEVGGVTDWLVDGINGFLAPGNPPAAAGLSEAIVKCLQSPSLHRELRAGAVRIASQFNMKHHLESLAKVFDEVCRGKDGNHSGLLHASL